jgi:hypothetical protein
MALDPAAELEFGAEYEVEVLPPPPKWYDTAKFEAYLREHALPGAAADYANYEWSSTEFLFLQGDFFASFKARTPRRVRVTHRETTITEWVDHLDEARVTRHVEYGLTPLQLFLELEFTLINPHLAMVRCPAMMCNDRHPCFVKTTRVVQ